MLGVAELRVIGIAAAVEYPSPAMLLYSPPNSISPFSATTPGIRCSTSVAVPTVLSSVVETLAIM
ncbi:MAG: hypothetical protein LBR13_02485 [Dysgonamonadaceae bacterium]|nr:hypothetical protein [Dysgonamonadaceae bacterium]